MKVECPKCNTVGRVDASKIPENGIKARCPKCDERFLVKKKNGAQEETSEKGKLVCPNCNHLRHEKDERCLYCGIVFSKHEQIEVPQGKSPLSVAEKNHGTSSLPVEPPQNDIDDLNEEEKDASSHHGSRSGSLRRKIIFSSIGVVVLLAFVYLWSLPYLAFYNIKSAVDEGDVEKLEEYVDFPSLRKSLKEQFKTAMTKTMMKEMQKDKNSTAKMIGIGLGVKIVESMSDGIIDSFVTPSGLRSVMQGKTKIKVKTPPKNKAPSDSEIAGENKKDFLKGADLGYASASKFLAKLKSDDGKRVTLVLRRGGLTWKLSDVILPLDDLNFSSTRMRFKSIS